MTRRQQISLSGIYLLSKVFSPFSIYFWWKRNFSPPSPRIVKESILGRFSNKDIVWIETGTNIGLMTRYLAKKSKQVYSLEPDRYLYSFAYKRLKKYKNVTLINGASEESLEGLLFQQTLDSVNFWLDGHFCGPTTFRGKLQSPVTKELDIISKNLGSMGDCTILIDDIRCFTPGVPPFQDYPSVDSLIAWGKKHGFNWSLEHDILILRRVQ